MTETSSKEQLSARTRLVRLVIVFIAIAVVALVAIWSGRKELAMRAVQSWCASLDMSCEGEFSALSLSKARLDGLKINRGAATPFAVDSLDVAYSWTGLTTIQLDKIELDRPVIRGVLEDEGLSFYGLETAYVADDGSEPAKDTPIPEIKIKDGKAVLNTVAGDVSASFEVDGRLIDEGSVLIELVPATLAHNGASLIWTRGDADLQFSRGAMTGHIEIDVEYADLGNISADASRIRAEVVDRDGQLRLLLRTEADQIQYGERYGNDILVELSANAARPSAQEQFDLLSALSALSLDASIGEFTDEAFGAGGLQIVADLTSDGRKLSGPIALEADMVTSHLADIGRLSVSGDFDLPERSADMLQFAYDGRFILHEVDASAAELTAVLEQDNLPDAVRPHGDQVARVVGRALADFDFGADFNASYDAGQWQVSATDPSIVQAATGLKLAIEPLPTRPWFEASNGLVELAGLIELGGGGGPDFQTYLEEVTWRAGAFDVFARDGVLQDWNVGGTTVFAEFDGLSFTQNDGGRFFVDGEVALAGEIADVELDRTRLFGKLEGAYGAEGWRVQTADTRCLGFVSGKIRSGTVALEPFAIELCPEEGRFVRQEGEATVGQIYLGDIQLPFATGDSSGEFNFTEAQLSWSSGDVFLIEIAGQTLSLPMVFGDKTLSIASAVPKVSASVGDGPLHIEAALEGTGFGGTMIPANVTAQTFRFEGEAAETGLVGKIFADMVRISDQNADPLYEPLISTLEADLVDGAIDMRGLLLNEQTGTGIADVQLQLHLTELNGGAQVKMRPLSFSPRGLQPTILSEQLRGVLINTQGDLSGQADFIIREGALEGTGHVAFRDVSFDTLKAGTVKGVNGRIAFQDILGLQSEPAQVFTIAEINPGVPLRDGEVQLQLTGPDSARLQAASWPFAGGTIQIQPTDWAVGNTTETVMLELTDIELSQLVDIFKVPDLRATGTVSGRFPIEFDGANIMLREAILKADEGGGTLAYVGGSLEAIEGRNQLADHGIEALQNFEFSVMELGLDGNLIGRLLVSIDLRGNNDDVLGGAVFHFGVRVDSELIPLLTSFSESRARSYAAEAILLEKIELHDEAPPEQNE